MGQVKRGQGDGDVALACDADRASYVASLASVLRDGGSCYLQRRMVDHQHRGAEFERNQSGPGVPFAQA
jgi:hypothetical protein